MEREPRRRDAEALDRYWDAVLAEHPFGAPAEVGEAQAELIGWLKSLGTTPGREEAQARIWAHLSLLMSHDRDEQIAELTADLPPGSPLIGANGRVAGLPVHDPPLRFPPQRRHWMVTQLATAALLTLMLIAGLVAFGPWRPGWREPSSGQLLPAITVATPDPIPGPVAEFLWQAAGDAYVPFRQPTGAAIDPQGNIWVTDGGNDRLVILSPEGVVLEAWGASGSGEGEFDFACSGLMLASVAFDAAGNIYVADSGNHRIQKFGPDRTFLTSWESEGSVDSQWLDTGRGNKGVANYEAFCPLSLIIDGQGRVYVGDHIAGKIEVFDADGKPLATWETEDLYRPEQLTFDGEGNVWVADTSSGLLKFSPDGKLLATWDLRGAGAGSNPPMGMAVDAEGRVFVSGQGARVQVFSPDGAFLGSWGSRSGDPGGFTEPAHLVLDGMGHIYTVDLFGHHVQKFRLLPPFGPG